MTYAAHHFARPAETLADMQANKRRYERMADAADFNNEPAVAWGWEQMARDEERKIVRHLSSVAHRAARIQHDRQDVPDETGNSAAVVVWLAVSGMVALLLIVSLILWAGLPHMAWPEACAGLSAAECTAWAQGGGR